MRIVVVACLAGCFGPGLHPSLTVVSPGAGTSITDHAPVALEVDIYEAFVDRLAIAVDGQQLASVFTVSPTPTGDECNPCHFEITWSALEVREGSHVVTVSALDRDSVVATDNIQLAFADQPEIVDIAPAADGDLVGAGTVNVAVTVVERGEATMVLDIDGIEATTKSSRECNSIEGCTFAYVWDTSTLPAGDHELHTVVTDAVGNTVDDTRSVRIDDLVKITSIEVTNTIDESGTLEIEVYAFDNVTNEFLGCAGRVAGLGPVDVSDQLYPVDATLVNPTDLTLRGSELGTHAIRFEVWEDDDAPVCPTPLDPAGNDLVGKSPARSIAAWKATPKATFTNVPELTVVIGRPLVR